jgi:hypothetical protein
MQLDWNWLDADPYGGPPDEVTVDADGHIDRGSFASYRELHDVLVAHGDDKPVLITEFG